MCPQPFYSPCLRADDWVERNSEGCNKGLNLLANVAPCPLFLQTSLNHKTNTTPLQLIACLCLFLCVCVNQENSEERPVSVNKQRLGAMGDRPARPSLIEQVLNQKRLVSYDANYMYYLVVK